MASLLAKTKVSKKVEGLEVGYVREGMYHFSVSCITLGDQLCEVTH